MKRVSLSSILGLHAFSLLSLSNSFRHVINQPVPILRLQPSPHFLNSLLHLHIIIGEVISSIIALLDNSPNMLTRDQFYKRGMFGIQRNTQTLFGLYQRQIHYMNWCLIFYLGGPKGFINPKQSGKCSGHFLIRGTIVMVAAFSVACP